MDVGTKFCSKVATRVEKNKKKVVHGKMEILLLLLLLLLNLLIPIHLSSFSRNGNIIKGGLDVILSCFSVHI